MRDDPVRVVSIVGDDEALTAATCALVVDRPITALVRLLDFSYSNILYLFAFCLLLSHE